MWHTYFSIMTPRSETMRHTRSVTMRHKIRTVTSLLESQAPLLRISRNVSVWVWVMNIVYLSNLYTCYGKSLVNRWWLPFYILSLCQSFWTMRDDSVTFPRICLSERFGMMCHATEAKCHRFRNSVALLRKSYKFVTSYFQAPLFLYLKRALFPYDIFSRWHVLLNYTGNLSRKVTEAQRFPNIASLLLSELFLNDV